MSHDAFLDGHITHIVQSYEISEQRDLQEKLFERGFEIPQATLSRRLKKLNIAKIAGVYTIVDLHQSQLPLVLNLQVSELGLIILHTHPGQAGSLAYFFDQKYVNYSSHGVKKTGILGTLAGDDTVLLIVEGKHDLPTVLGQLYEEFPYLRRA